MCFSFPSQESYVTYEDHVRLIGEIISVFGALVILLLEVRSISCTKERFHSYWIGYGLETNYKNRYYIEWDYLLRERYRQLE